MESRYANLFALLVAASMQAAVVWQDSSTPWQSKLVCTLLACLGLALTREKVAEVEQVIVLACLVAGTVLTVVLGHLSVSSAFASTTSTALTSVTQVRRLLALHLAGGTVPLVEVGDAGNNRVARVPDFSQPASSHSGSDQK